MIGGDFQPRRFSLVTDAWKFFDTSRVKWTSPGNRIRVRHISVNGLQTLAAISTVGADWLPVASANAESLLCDDRAAAEYGRNGRGTRVRRGLNARRHERNTGAYGDSRRAGRQHFSARRHGAYLELSWHITARGGGPTTGRRHIGARSEHSVLSARRHL